MQHDTDAFSQGADALEAGDFAMAGQCFEAWLQQAPQDADVFLRGTPVPAGTKLG